MNKANKLLLIGLILLLVTTSIGNAFTNTRTNKLDTVNSIISLEFEFDEPIIETTYQQNHQVQKITIPNLHLTNEENNPVIPVKPVKILLPYGKTLDKISVEFETTPEIYKNIELKKGTKLFHIDSIQNDFQNKFIDSKKASQSLLYKNIGIYYCRGFPILFLNIYPVSYNAEINEVTYYPNLKLNIHTIDASPSKALRSISKDTAYISSIVENPSYIDTYPIIPKKQSNNVQYVVITSEQLARSGLEDNFQTLINDKLNKGLTAEIFIIEDIINDPSYSINGTWGDNNPSNPFYQHKITKNYQKFDDKAARIRNFIRFAYMELGAEYILLGGDGDRDSIEENIIPARGLFANESGLPLYISTKLEDEEDDIPSDIYYACLDGSFNYDMDEHFGESPDRNDIMELDEADLISEVSVGRACVDSEIEIAHFVSKTLQYENSNHPYLSKILFIGEYLGFPGISAYGSNYKDLVKPYIPGNYNLETLYDRDLPTYWTKGNLIEIINNATPHIINHDGHAYYGYNLKMHNADVDLLTNSNSFFVYSHGCMAGGFDNPNGYDCIAERLTVETPHGAFALIMNARYGLGSEDSLVSPSQALDESFFKALFIENIREIGKANHYSKEDQIWQINENGIRWVYYETNLFGDPELSIKNPNQNPTELFIEITNPENGGVLYLKNLRICSFPFFEHPVIIGSITIDVEASSDPPGNIFSVEFLIDNQSTFVDQKEPFSWTITSTIKGIHTLSAIVHGYYGNTERVDRIIQIWILS